MPVIPPQWRACRPPSPCSLCPLLSHTPQAWKNSVLSAIRSQFQPSGYLSYPPVHRRILWLLPAVSNHPQSVPPLLLAVPPPFLSVPEHCPAEIPPASSDIPQEQSENSPPQIQAQPPTVPFPLPQALRPPWPAVHPLCGWLPPQYLYTRPAPDRLSGNSARFQGFLSGR